MVKAVAWKIAYHSRIIGNRRIAGRVLRIILRFSFMSGKTQGHRRRLREVRRGFKSPSWGTPGDFAGRVRICLPFPHRSGTEAASLAGTALALFLPLLVFFLDPVRLIVRRRFSPINETSDLEAIQ